MATLKNGSNQAINWPIYSLANYDNNSGLLVEELNAAISHQRNTTKQSTGSYHTTNEWPTVSTNEYQLKRTSRHLSKDEDKIKSDRSKCQINNYNSDLISWWKLVEPAKIDSPGLVTGKVEDPTDRIRDDILKFCSILIELIGPYLCQDELNYQSVDWRRKNGSKTSSNNANHKFKSSLSMQNLNVIDRFSLEKQSTSGIRSNSGRSASPNRTGYGTNLRRSLTGNALFPPDEIDRNRDQSIAAKRKRQKWLGQQRRDLDLGRDLLDDSNRPNRRINETFSLSSAGGSTRGDGRQMSGSNATKSSWCLLDEWQVRAKLKYHNIVHTSYPFQYSTRRSQSTEYFNWSRQALARGKFGESLIHILLINHSNEHLIVLVLILHLWPQLIRDTFLSKKFHGLSCLHLAVAYNNERLLRHLIELCPAHLIDQQVTGSLFRWPAKVNKHDQNNHCAGARSLAKTRDNNGKLIDKGGSNKQKVSDSQLTMISLINQQRRSISYWCDRLEHWPAANGQAHLILLDRLRSRAKFNTTIASSNDDLSNHSSQMGPVYLGHTPLAWSVSFNLRHLYELLAGHGQANQDSQDFINGNTCLHQLIINNQLGWSRFLVKSGSNVELLNYSHKMTPFQLACQMGRVELFNEILELKASEFWAYSSVKCCGYSLIDLDSIIADVARSTKNISNKVEEHQAQRQQQSAISVILKSTESNNEQKSALLSSPVVQRLLEEKWKHFGKRLFYKDLIRSLVHLILFTVAIVLRPTIGRRQQMIDVSHHRQLQSYSGVQLMQDILSKSINLTLVNRNTWIRYVCELATLYLSSSQLIRALVEWIRYKDFSLQWICNPLLVSSILANSLVLLCVPARMIGFLAGWSRSSLLIGHSSLDIFNGTHYSQQAASTGAMTMANPQLRLRWFDEVEDISLIIAAPLLWSSLLFFVAAFRVTGPFVAMTWHMIWSDLRQFGIVYLIFVYAFAQGIFFVNYGPLSASNSTTVNNTDSNSNTSNITEANKTISNSSMRQLATNYLELAMELFKMTLGVFELQPYRHSALARVFFVLHLCFVQILLNMLIAMMNNTYSLINSQSERAWSFQWARTLFAIERRLSDEEKLNFLRKYSINLSVNTKSSTSDAENNDVNGSPTTSFRKDSSATSHGSIELEQDGTARDFTPGLMIIKQTNCTRAERRRKIFGHWQRWIKRVLSDLRTLHS